MKNIRPVANKGNYSLPDLELTVSLNRSETMVVRSAQKTADLLKHEQGHFDITVLSVRAFAIELQRLNAPSAASLAQQIDALRQKHQRFADAIEEKYDEETDGSRSKDVQDEWNKAIQGAMAAKNAVSLRSMPL
jgi:DNA anti-recombination protein RmuC